MKFLILILCWANLGFSSPWKAHLHTPLYDSAHSLILEGTIQEGLFFSDSSLPNVIKHELETHFYYLVGQLNGMDGVVDLSQLSLELLTIEALPEGGFKVTYRAHLILAWPLEAEIPNSLTALLPKRGSYDFRREFFEKFGREQGNPSNCLDWSAHDVSYDIFWYYYRPFSWNCPLKDSSELRDLYVVETEIKLQVSPKNTQDKSPEYQKIWEDQTLRVLIVNGMDKGEDPSENDIGLKGFQSLHQNLLRSIPGVSASTLGATEKPKLKDWELHYVWDLGPSKKLEIHNYLIPGIRSYNPDFNKIYNELTQKADLVIYNGHSGLGANIRALARLGKFTPGQYQIYFINGCDTFAYVDQALTLAHAQVNPGEAGTKYLDLIINAMPSYFSHMPTSTTHLIQSLLEGSQNYREILSGLPKVQRAIVSGEEDND